MFLFMLVKNESAFIFSLKLIGFTASHINLGHFFPAFFQLRPLIIYFGKSNLSTFSIKNESFILHPPVQDLTHLFHLYILINVHPNYTIQCFEMHIIGFLIVIFT